jgi:DNA processing protein
MDVDEERAAWVALALVPGIGATRFDALLQQTGTPLGALKAPFEFLCTIRGISRAAATAIHGASVAGGRQVLASLAAVGGTVLLPPDPGFPEVLRQIPDGPTALFAYGDLALLDRPAVAVVGSRDHSAYGASVCREMSTGAAAAGLAVISGMARGLDAIAHAAALEADGATIGILGNGLGVIYPAANRELYERVAAHGLLLTEFPPGERPRVGYFPRRNRLISALARVTVVIEAANGSGTLITVGTALAQGKDVMAVPGPITSPTSVGTNRLIRDGAEPLLELADLLAHYPEVGPAAVPAGSATRRLGGSAEAPSAVAPPSLLPEPPADLDPSERRLFDQLLAESCGVDELITRTALPTPVALVALSVLELRGLVRQSRGRFELSPPGTAN